MVHRSCRLALVLPLLLVSASPARAYCRFTTCAASVPPPGCFRDAAGCFAAGIPLVWQEQCLSYSVPEAGSPKLGLDRAAVEELAQRGFSMWPNAQCADGPPSIALRSLEAHRCDRVAYHSSGPNANAIIFRDDVWTHDPLAIALTSVMFNPRTGRILGADMEINSGDYDLSAQNLIYVFGHESGHFLGLDHSDQVDALMFATYSLDTGGELALTPDDVAGICDAYPTSRPTTAGCDDFQPEKGFAPDCGGNVLASCGVAGGPSPRLFRGAGAGVDGALAALLVAAGLTAAALAHRTLRRPRRRSRFF
jgi:hypothetical protein